MQKIDSKMIAAITLILGLLVGFYVDNSFLSKPRIDTLTETITEQTTTITDLETQLDDLQDTHDSLQAEYDQLYTEFQQQSEEEESRRAQLEDQIESLLNSVDTLETVVNDKNSEIIDLEEQLDILTGKYAEIVNPMYTAFTLEELNINLTVTTNSYQDNSEMTGLVTITHTNGTPFTGSFKLNLIKVYPNIGTPSDFYDIQGSKIYSWNNPFVLGAGSYKLTLSEIKDSVGNTVLTSTQLRPYAIYLFLG